MYGYIYITTNKINSKQYIGKHKWNKQTIDESYLGSGKLLKNAINYYGQENFNYSIIEYCDSLEELNTKEQYWIKKYDAVNNPMFYNLAKGGDGGIDTVEPWNKGIPATGKMLENLEYGRHLPASKKLIEKLHNRKDLVEYTPEYRAKLSKATKEYFSKNDMYKMLDLENKQHSVKLEEINAKLALGWKPMDKSKNSKWHKLKGSTTIR